jgi:hypothetical protein
MSLMEELDGSLDRKSDIIAALLRERLIVFGRQTIPGSPRNLVASRVEWKLRDVGNHRAIAG